MNSLPSGRLQVPLSQTNVLNFSAGLAVPRMDPLLLPAAQMRGSTTALFSSPVSQPLKDFPFGIRALPNSVLAVCSWQANDILHRPAKLIQLNPATVALPAANAQPWCSECAALSFKPILQNAHTDGNTRRATARAESLPGNLQDRATKSEGPQKPKNDNQNAPNPSVYRDPSTEKIECRDSDNTFVADGSDGSDIDVCAIDSSDGTPPPQQDDSSNPTTSQSESAEEPSPLVSSMASLRSLIRVQAATVLNEMPGVQTLNSPVETGVSTVPPLGTTLKLSQHPDQSPKAIHSPEDEYDYANVRVVDHVEEVPLVADQYEPRKIHRPRVRLWKERERRRKANQRERDRVKRINDAFDNLQDKVPALKDYMPRVKSPSKLSILQAAIKYMHSLEDELATGKPHRPPAAKRDLPGSMTISNREDMEDAKLGFSTESANDTAPRRRSVCYGESYSPKEITIDLGAKLRLYRGGKTRPFYRRLLDFPVQMTTEGFIKLELPRADTKPTVRDEMEEVHLSCSEDGSCLTDESRDGDTDQNSLEGHQEDKPLVSISTQQIHAGHCRD